MDITSCSYFTNQSQCTNLIQILEINQILLLKDNIKSFKNLMLNDVNISDNFKKYITKSNFLSSDGYRLFIEYNDGQCASIRM